VVKIEGCDYRVSKEMILSWLGLYGEVLSDVVEDVFEDSEDSEGTNATGIYSVKMKLSDDIPQLLPMDGRRIKVYYRGISKLCTSCFGRHTRRDCKNEKVQWIDYVRNFVNKNPQISNNQYGKWISILERETRQKSNTQENNNPKQTQSTEQASSTEIREESKRITPSVVLQNANSNGDEINDTFIQNSANLEASTATQSTGTTSQDGDQLSQINLSQPTMVDFNIPETDEDMTKLIDTMIGCGMTRKDVETNIEKRKKMYMAAVRDFNKLHTKKGRQMGTRKNSK